MTDSLYITWTSADFYPFSEAGVQELSVNTYYIEDTKKFNKRGYDVVTDIYKNAKKFQTERERGDNHIIRNFYLSINLGRWDEPFEVTKAIPQPAKLNTMKTGSTSRKSSWEWGEELMAKNGWTLYKKTLPDNRIVYNCVKDKLTPTNKDQWNEIRGEVYTEAGFKWSPRTQSFQYWGEMNNEKLEQKVPKLFDVLGKYYGTNVPKPTLTDLQQYTNEEAFEIIMSDYRKEFEASQAFFEFVNLIEKHYIFTRDQKMYFRDKWIDKETQEPSKNEPEPMPSKKEEPEPPFKLNDSYLSLPNNPKLDYIRINASEGFPEYSELFPMTFGSFKQITKFIADNCVLEKVGYDKHFVSWKFSDRPQIFDDRWDIGISDSNPKRWVNLWAKEELQSVIHPVLYGSDIDILNTDDFYSSLGSDGMELTKDEFYDIINFFCGLEYYNVKRFPNYTTFAERLAKVKASFPKLFSIFDNQSQEPVSKEMIEKKIKVLSILAKNGDTLADKKIKVLKILLQNQN